MALNDIILRIRAQNDASGGLNSLGNDFRRVSSVVAAAAASATAALGGMTAAIGITEISRAGMAFQGYRAALGSVADGAANAEAVLKYLKQTSNDLGLDMEATTEQFTLLTAAAKGTSMQGKPTMEIFEGISMAMTALGRSTDDTSGALNAIQQMISKGKVSSEELKEQLGERLPGAFQLAAQAMGVTTDKLFKMLEDGKVMADDLLPKMASELKKRYGEAADAAADGMRANINRVKNGFTELSDTIFKSGFGDAVNNQLKGVLSIISGPDSEALGQSLGASLGSAVTMVGSAASQMKTILMAGLQVAQELNSELGIIDKINSAFTGLSSVASSAASNIDLVKAALVGLVAVKATTTVLSLGAAFVGLTAALTPIGLAIGAVVAGIGAATGAVYYFRDSTIEFGNQQVSLGSLVSGVWTTITEGISTRFTEIKDTLSGLYTFFSGVFSNIATEADGKLTLVGGALLTLNSVFSNFADNAKSRVEIFLGVIQSIRTAITELGASILTLDLSRFLNIDDSVTEAFSSQQGSIDRGIASFQSSVASNTQKAQQPPIPAAAGGVPQLTPTIAENLAKAAANTREPKANQDAMTAANNALLAELGKLPEAIATATANNTPAPPAPPSPASISGMGPSDFSAWASLIPGALPNVNGTIAKGVASLPSPDAVGGMAASPSVSNVAVRDAASAALGNPVIAPKGPDEEAIKAAEKELKDYQKRIERLTDTFLPAKARSLEFKEAQVDLSRALKEGKISQEEYNIMTAQAQEILGSGSGVMAAALRDLDEQARLLGVSSKARETESAVIQLENEAKRDGIKLTAEEIDLYRKRYDALKQQEIDSTFAERQQDRVKALREEISLFGMRGAARERQTELYSAMAEAENAGVSDAAGAIKEYMAAFDELQAKEAAHKGSVMGGIRDALYEQVEASKDVAGQVRNTFNAAISSIEDAFIQTALTGKISFTDMANSIHKELLKFAVGGVRGALMEKLLAWVGDGTEAGSTDKAQSGIVGVVQAAAGASGATAGQGAEGVAKTAAGALGGMGQSIGSAVINIGSATITGAGMPGMGGGAGEMIVSGGKTITSTDALQGVNDNAATKGPFSFLTDMLSGITDFFGGFFSKITDVFSGLASGLGNVFSSALSGIGSLFSGGAGGGSSLVSGIGSLFAGVFHTGGTAGNADVTRQISASVFANANRYHVGGMAGLQPGEVPAILERGELILTKSQTSNLSDMLSNGRNDNGTRMANNNSGNGPIGITINQHFNGTQNKDDMRQSAGVTGQVVLSTLERHRRRNG